MTFNDLSFLFPFSKRLLIRLSCFFSIFFFLFLCSGPADAADLFQVYEMARENDSTFQSQSYRHEAAPETYRQAFSEMLPVLSFDAFYQENKHKINDTDIAVFGDDEADYSSKGFDLVLRQPIFKYSSLVRISQAKEEVKRADLEFEAAGQDLIMRVTEAYFKVLEARDVLMFSKSEENAVNQHYKLAKERYDNGLAPITDYHDAKARLASITAKRIKAENNLEDAFEGLAELTGNRIDLLEGIKLPDIEAASFYNGGNSADDENKPGIAMAGNSYFNSLVPRDAGKYAGDSIPLITPLPDDIEKWVSSARVQNLNVLIKEKELEVARKEVSRQASGRYPSLSLVGRYNRDDEGGSLYGGSSDTEKWEGAIELKVPLFSGFSVSSKVQEARLLLKASEKEMEKEIRSATRLSKAAFLGIKSSIDNIKALKQALISNKITLEAKREGFKSGIFPSLAVTDAERDFYQTKQEYAKSQYDYVLNSLKLKKAVGLLKEEDIITVNRWLE